MLRAACLKSGSVDSSALLACACCESMMRQRRRRHAISTGHSEYGAKTAARTRCRRFFQCVTETFRSSTRKSLLVACCSSFAACLALEARKMTQTVKIYALSEGPSFEA